MAAAAKPAGSSNPAPLSSPSLRAPSSSAKASSAAEGVFKRSHSNPELKPRKVSIGEVFPRAATPPSLEGKGDLSNPDFIFKKNKENIAGLNKKLTELATPQDSTYQYDVIMQQAEIAFLKLVKQLDDPDSLFNTDQKHALFEMIREGFSLLRAAFIQKHPSVDFKQVSAITQPRLEAVELRLRKLTETDTDDPLPLFPTRTLIPDPVKRNELFPKQRPTHASHLFKHTLEHINEINKELAEYANPKDNNYFEVAYYEKKLLKIVDQLDDPDGLYSSEQKIELFNLINEGFKLLKAAVIAKMPYSDKQQLSTIHRHRELAIKSRLDALKTGGSSAPIFTKFPTETLYSDPSSTTRIFWLAIALLIGSGLASFVVYRRIYTKT